MRVKQNLFSILVVGGKYGMKQKLFLDVSVDKIDAKCKLEEKKTNYFKTTHYAVAKETKREVKREIGDYFVMQFTYETLLTKQSLLTKEVERILKQFLKQYQKTKKVLVIGLGNKEVDGDALGVITTNKVIATNQYHDFLTLPKIALFNPSVTEKTGINSFNLIEMVVRDLKPDVIIMIDSLATKSEEYLNCAIEMNDTGIIPGSALNSSKEISHKTFGIPVLTIGAPLCLEINKKFYTSVFIHEVLEATSNIIANSLNTIFIKHS